MLSTPFVADSVARLFAATVDPSRSSGLRFPSATGTAPRCASAVRARAETSPRRRPASPSSTADTDQLRCCTTRTRPGDETGTSTRPSGRCGGSSSAHRRAGRRLAAYAAYSPIAATAAQSCVASPRHAGANGPDGLVGDCPLRPSPSDATDVTAVRPTSSIHGACHDGSAFDRVVERIRAAGATAYAPTVAGHGKDVDKRVTHAESVQSVLDFILDRELTDFVLLGHSYGGTIIAKVAEAVPERVRRLVFLSAYGPQRRRDASWSCSHQVTVSCSPNWRRRRRTTPSRCPSMSFARCSSTTPIWTRRAGRTRQLSSEPFAQLLEPLDLKRFHALGIPRSVLVADRGHGDAARRMGMAPETVQQARHVSPRSDARKSRADVQQPGGPGRQDPRGRPGLTPARAITTGDRAA